jgi:hypothetical protein
VVICWIALVLCRCSCQQRVSAGPTGKVAPKSEAGGSLQNTGLKKTGSSEGKAKPGKGVKQRGGGKQKRK